MPSKVMMTYINRHPEKSSCHPNRFPVGKTKKTRQKSRNIWVSWVICGSLQFQIVHQAQTPIEQMNPQPTTIGPSGWLLRLTHGFFSWRTGSRSPHESEVVPWDPAEMVEFDEVIAMCVFPLNHFRGRFFQIDGGENSF